MNREETQRWLAELQARFGEVLRQPLDHSGRQLRAPVESYPERTLADLKAGPHTSAHERLAVYHRQYWFRLFGVLQSEFPLTARLLGMWTFNGLASRFLVREPPRHYDIQHVAHGFAAFLARELTDEAIEIPQGTLPSRAVLEASAIDEAFAQVLAAPLRVPFAFTPEHAAVLPRARLEPASSWQLVRESWPLMALRQQLAGDQGEHSVPLPPAHAGPQHWVVYAGAQGYGALPLPAVRARLLAALRELSVSEALARVEQGANREERALLLAQAQTWLADSVQRGFWSGLRVPEPER